MIEDGDLPRVIGPAVQSYRDLIVWQKGMSLAEVSYRVTAGFPREETYGLTAQIRRAASSIPANVAEGFGRDNTGSFVQHLRIAQGSLKELETHRILAQRIGLLDRVGLEPLLSDGEELGKMPRALIRPLQSRREG